MIRLIHINSLALVAIEAVRRYEAQDFEPRDELRDLIALCDALITRVWSETDLRDAYAQNYPLTYASYLADVHRPRFDAEVDIEIIEASHLVEAAVLIRFLIENPSLAPRLGFQHIN